MKLIVDSADLKAALTTLGRAANTKSGLPILGMVKIQATIDGLILTATDLDIAAEVIISDLAIQEPGECCAPLAELQKFVGLKKATGKLQIALCDDALEVSVGKAEISFATLPVTDFPNLTAEGVNLRPVQSEPLSKALGWCDAASSDEEVRYFLRGVCLTPCGEGMKVYGTDGNRAHMVTLPDMTVECAGIVPSEAVPLLTSIMSKVPGAQFGLSENKWMIDAGSVRAWGKLIEGTYPDIEKAMDRAFLDIGFASLDDLSGALGVAETGASLFDKTKSRQIIMQCDERFQIRGWRPGAALRKTARFDFDGDMKAKAAMCLSSSYLAAAVQGMPDGDVAVEMEVDDDHIASVMAVEPREQSAVLGMRAVIMGHRIQPQEAWVT